MIPSKSGGTDHGTERAGRQAVPPALAAVAARLLATDPGLVRARMGLRVASTLALVGLCLAGLHHAAVPMPTAAFAAGMTFAIQGGVAIRDPSPAKRLRTRVVSAAVGILVLASCSLLTVVPGLVEGAFLVVVFAAVFVRRWGMRWTTVGMFAFMACFAGAYFRPAPSDLPTVALAIAMSGLVAHLVREFLVPDHPVADLQRALAGVDHRVGRVAALLGEGSRKGWTTRGHRRVLAAHQRVRDALGVVETMLPDEPMRSPTPLDPRPLAIELFDLNLALESALSDALSPEKADEVQRLRVAGSLRRLARLRRHMRRASVGLAEKDLALDEAPTAAPSPSGEPRPWWEDATTRLALQVTLACALAMAGGMWLSPDRWFWAVLTAFLVFTNVQSRGDTALRGLGRAAGTAAGIVVGMGLAVLVHGEFALSLGLGFVFVFLAFFFLQASYGTMTFFVTVTLALVYGLLGNFSPSLLVLRLEETVIGAAAGVLVSFLVFPQRTSEATERAASAFLTDLNRLMDAVGERLDGNASAWRLYAISRALDRRHAAILAASRPLGRNWASGARQRSVRVGRLRFAVLAHWAHRLAAASAQPIANADALRDALALCRRTMAAVSPADFFKRTGQVPRFAPMEAVEAKGHEEHDPVLALRAITHTLAQISSTPTPPPETRGTLEATETASQTAN